MVHFWEWGILIGALKLVGGVWLSMEAFGYAWKEEEEEEEENDDEEKWAGGITLTINMADAVAMGVKRDNWIANREK